MAEMGARRMMGREARRVMIPGARGLAPGLGVMVWVGVVMLAVAGPARAVTPAVLVDRELEAQRVRVTGLAESQISYFDSERRLQSAPVSRFVQLRGIGREGVSAVASAAVPEGEGAVLVLVDGQRLSGRWAGPAAEGEAVRWVHPQLGEVTVALEDVLAWGAVSATTAASRSVVRDGPPTQDRAVLTNGDVLRGFLVAVTEAGISIQPEDADEPIALDAQRVAHVVLANPVAAGADDRQTLVLADGSVLAARDLSLRRERLTFRPMLGGEEAGAIEMPFAAVERVDFTKGGVRLVRLIDQPRTVSGGEVFGLPMGPWVEAMEADGADEGRAALRLHAPVSVTFELPRGARRVAGVAELARGGEAPAELTAWADFELVVEAAGEPMRHRLHGGSPAVGLNVAVEAERLRLTLEPGVNGPVLDRMRLRDGVVLVEGAESDGDP